MALTILTDLPLLSLNGNPMKVKVNTDNLLDYSTRRPFYTIILNIYDKSDDSLIKSLSAEPDDDGNVWFDLANAFYDLKPTLFYNFKFSDFHKDTNDIRKFYFKLAEGYGIPYIEQSESFTSNDYYVIPGGVSDNILKTYYNDGTSFYYEITNVKNIFLTNQPDRKTVLTEQPEILRYFHNHSSNRTVDLKSRRLLPNGTTETVTVESATMSAYSLYSINAMPSNCRGLEAIEYTLWLEASGVVISNELTYILDNFIPDNTRYVYFQNSLGGFDCVALTGKMLNEIELQSATFFTPLVNQLRDVLEPGQERALGIRYLTGTVGWKNKEEMEWLTELLLSEQRLLVTGSWFETVIITPDRRQTSSDDNVPQTMNLEMIIGVPDFFFLTHV